MADELVPRLRALFDRHYDWLAFGVQTLQDAGFVDHALLVATEVEVRPMRRSELRRCDADAAAFVLADEEENAGRVPLLLLLDDGQRGVMWLRLQPYAGSA